MASCDIVPRLKQTPDGRKNVPSKLFPDILNVVKDRELAKSVYEQIFDDEFIAWFGQWSGNKYPANLETPEIPKSVYLQRDRNQFFLEKADISYLNSTLETVVDLSNNVHSVNPANIITYTTEDGVPIRYITGEDGNLVMLKETSEPSGLSYDTGEPMLVFPATSSPVELLITSPYVGHKPYGKGLYMNPGKSDGLQAGFIKIKNPVSPGSIHIPPLIQILSDRIGNSLPEQIIERLNNLNDLDMESATKELASVISELEFEYLTPIWTHQQDIKNVWEVFDYDGIINADEYVVFNVYDYWAAWNNDDINVIDIPAQESEEKVTPKESRIEKLERKFNARVELNPNLPEGVEGRVRKENDTPVIEVRDSNDHLTLLHEYAHILIDGLGGLSNPHIKRGVDLVRGTPLWNEIKGRYPELNETGLAKEVLAEVVGREAHQLMVNDSYLLGQIQNWLALFFDRVKELFGLEVNQVRQLARELLKEDTPGEFSIQNLPTDYQERRKQYTEKEKKLTRKKEMYNKIIDNINNRVQELKQSGDKEGVKKFNIVKHKLRKDLDSSLTYSGMIEFLDQAFEDLDNLYIELYNSIQNNTLTSAQLWRIHTSAQAYSTLKDIHFVVHSDPEMSKELGAEYLQNLDFLINTYDKINYAFREEGRELALEALLPFNRKLRRGIEREYEREWREKNAHKYKGKNKERMKRDMAMAVSKRMEEERASIALKEENSLRSQLQEAMQDVGSVEMWVTAMKNTNDEILQIVAEMVDDAERRVHRDSIKLKYQIEEMLRPLREYKGNPADLSVLFEDIIERDSGGYQTNYVVGEYYSEYSALERAFRSKNRITWLQDPRQAALDRESFYRKHGKINPEFEQWSKARNTAEHNLSGLEFEQWKAENPKPKEFIPDDKYRNPQYLKLVPGSKEYLGDDNPVVRFYKFFVQKQKEFDDMIPISGKQLGLRLPSIQKSVTERVTEGDISGILENIKNITRWTTDDTDEGVIISEEGEDGKITYVRKDAKGRRLNYIPVHYRSSIAISDQSYDLGTLLLLNGHMASNYKEKNAILPDLLLIQEQIRTRQVGQIRGGKQMFLKDDKTKRHTIVGEQSKSYRLLEAFMDFRMYGRHTAENDPLINYSKKIGALMSYTGMLLLGGNILAGVANLFLGETLFFSEAVSNQFIGLEDWREAQKYYATRLANTSLIGDIGRGRYESDLNLLMDYFNAENTYNPLTHKFGDKNAAMRLVKQSSIYGINNIGEHHMHGVTMLALLNRIKVVNSKGEWVNDKGKKVSSKADAKTLLSAYSAKDGVLVLDDSVKEVEWDGKYYKVGKELDDRITRRLQQLNEYMHGAYADQNSNYMQRYVAGRMAIMMRKWIEPGIRKRFAGMKGLLQGRDELRWDQQLDDYFEGSMTSTARFFVNSWKEGEGWKFALAANWKKMSDIERANIYRMAVEFSFMVASKVFAHMMYSIARDMDDDDEANRYWYLGYQSNRLFSELFFYYPPLNLQEAYRVLKSPAATISVFERSGRLFMELFPPYERYESGRHEGELKIKKYASDMIPLLGPIDRLNNMADLVNIVYN